MAMAEKTLVEQFQEILQREKEKRAAGKSKDLLAGFDKLYKELVEKGWIKKRKYILRGIEDTHLRTKLTITAV